MLSHCIHRCPSRCRKPGGAPRRAVHLPDLRDGLLPWPRSVLLPIMENARPKMELPIKIDWTRAPGCVCLAAELTAVLPWSRSMQSLPNSDILPGPKVCYHDWLHAVQRRTCQTQGFQTCSLHFPKNKEKTLRKF